MYFLMHKTIYNTLQQNTTHKAWLANDAYTAQKRYVPEIQNIQYE